MQLTVMSQICVSLFFAKFKINFALKIPAARIDFPYEWSSRLKHRAVDVAPRSVSNINN